MQAVVVIEAAEAREQHLLCVDFGIKACVTVNVGEHDQIWGTGNHHLITENGNS